MWQLVHTYGITPAYLAQGTRANIQKYFGLVWLIDPAPQTSGRGAVAGVGFHDGEYKWFYQGHNESGNNSSGNSNPQGVKISGTAGPISRVMDIAAVDGVTVNGTNAREPDFFELLKASVAAGSKAKGAFNSATVLGANFVPNSFGPYIYQNSIDTSIDYAIIQLGANIIDSFKVDGYCTRIVFNDNSGNPREFRGAQNLPYIYRVSTGTMKLRTENPVITGKPPQERDAPTQVIFRDTGVGLLMSTPTIWNPYDRYAPLGYPGPSGGGVGSAFISGTNNFRCIADSTYPLDEAPTSTNSTEGTIYMGFFASASSDQNGSTASGYATQDAGTYTIGPNGSLGSIYPPNTLAYSTPLPPPLNPVTSALYFQVPDETYFREPTPLAMAGYPGNQGNGCKLSMAAPTGISQYNKIKNAESNLVWTGSGFTCDGSTNPLDLPNGDPGASRSYVGFALGLYPIIWAGKPVTSGTLGVYESVNVTLDFYGGIANASTNNKNNNPQYITYRMQYADPNTLPYAANAYNGSDGGTTTDPTGSWVTYDEKYNFADCLFLSTPLNGAWGNLTDHADGAPGADWESYTDPRTSRFGAVNGVDYENPVQTPGGSNEAGEWADQPNGICVTDRPDANSGYDVSSGRNVGANADFEFLNIAAAGWSVGQYHYRMGLLEQNSTLAYDNFVRFSGDSQTTGGDPLHFAGYYQDPDGVVRGAMGYYNVGTLAPAGSDLGMPLATAYPSTINTIGQPPSTALSGTYQGESRPYMLHRPFRSVAELGYVFSGTPWKNIDLFTPQSGDAPLLDAFTAYETPNTSSELIGGVVNLNTRQVPVLQAILAGATVDEAQSSGTANTPYIPFTGAQINSMLSVSGTANFLSRTNPTNTKTGYGPLQNLSDLVGRYYPTLLSGTNYASGYSGVSADLTSVYQTVFTQNSPIPFVDRMHEAFIRPLAAAGGTRVWNLLIDVVAQAGRYPSGTTNPANFVVEGEQRYWVHVAIDRLTGQVLDKQVEVVKD
jgi:hypothetical protein